MTVFFTSEGTAVADFDASSGTIEETTDDGRSVLKMHAGSLLQVNVPDAAGNNTVLIFIRARLEGCKPGNGSNAQRVRFQFRGTVGGGGTTINAAQYELYGTVPYGDHCYHLPVGGTFDAGSMRIELRHAGVEGFLYIDRVEARYDPAQSLKTYDYTTDAHTFGATPIAVEIGPEVDRRPWRPAWIGSSTHGNGLKQYRENIGQHGVAAWLDEVGMVGWGVVRADTYEPYHHYTDSYGRSAEITTYYPNKGVTCGPGTLCEVPDGDQNNLVPTLLTYLAANDIGIMLTANCSTSNNVADPAGTTDPAIIANELRDFITQCKAAGVTVYGVELGNELYRSSNDTVFPTVASYIARIQAVTPTLRAYHPDVPIVIATFGKIHDTNKPGDEDYDAALSAAYIAGDLDVDAIQVHPYFQTFDVFGTGTDRAMARHDRNELVYLEERWRELFPGLRWSANETNPNGSDETRANKSVADALFWANMYRWAVSKGDDVLSLQMHSIMQVQELNGQGLTVSSNPGVVAMTAQPAFFFIKEFARLAKGRGQCSLRTLTTADPEITDNLQAFQLFGVETSVLCLANSGADPYTVRVPEWEGGTVDYATTDNSRLTFDMSLPLGTDILLRGQVTDGLLTVPPMSVMLAEGPGGSTIEAWWVEQYGTRND